MTASFNHHAARATLTTAVLGITGIDPVATDANHAGAEVEFVVWVRAEDADRFLTALNAAGDRGATIDLHGPPRYCRSTTDGAPVTWASPRAPLLGETIREGGGRP